MAETTGITWADATWNSFYGCHKVSQGCKNCYMFRDMAHYGKDPNHVQRAAPTTFNAPLKWARNGKVQPGARIFTCSWSDWFIEEADDWRAEAWEIVRQTPQFTYMILTKRPERIAGHLPADWDEGYKIDGAWGGHELDGRTWDEFPGVTQPALQDDDVELDSPKSLRSEFQRVNDPRKVGQP